MTTRHTPGPWGLDAYGAVAGVGGVVIAQTVHDTRYAPSILSALERDANARLIAAAPDLLAALEDATALFCADHEACRFCDADTEAGEDHDPDAMCSTMIAAIAKARGQEVKA